MKKSRLSSVDRFLAELAGEIAKLSPTERRRNLESGATFAEAQRGRSSKPATSASARAVKARVRAAR